MVTSMREPTPAMVRGRLHLATRHELEQKFIYEAGCRVSEATDPRYRVEGQDLSIQDFEGEEFLVINLRTSKREGLPRTVASSLRLDPLARDIWEGVEGWRPRSGPLFDIGPLAIRRAVVNTFWGLSYPIMSYKISEKTLDGEIIKEGYKVDSHWRPFSVHALRHLRATELSQHYGFTGEDLARFLGWTMSSARLSNMIERYEIYNWKKYGHRLLIPPPWVPPGLNGSPGREDKLQNHEKDKATPQDQDVAPGGLPQGL